MFNVQKKRNFRPKFVGIDEEVTREKSFEVWPISFGSCHKVTDQSPSHRCFAGPQNTRSRMDVLFLCSTEGDNKKIKDDFYVTLRTRDSHQPVYVCDPNFAPKLVRTMSCTLLPRRPEKSPPQSSALTVQASPSLNPLALLTNSLLSSASTAIVTAKIPAKMFPLYPSFPNTHCTLPYKHSSAPPAKTTPTLKLPPISIEIKQEYQSPSQRNLKRPRTPPKIEITILFAEDSATCRAVNKKIASVAGVKCEMAVDGLECCKMVQKNPKQFDLILMDIVMPEMNGIEAAENLKNNGFKVPIIPISGVGTDEIKQRCVAVGMCGFLEKPLTVQKLRDLLVDFSLC